MPAKSECRNCGKTFISLEAFDAHRTGRFRNNTRRCLTEQEMCAAGMRRGELLALRWDDIDYKQGLVSVHRTMTRVGGYGYVEGEPKTRSSRRRIVLPSVALEALRVHRIQQEQIRVNVGEKWQDKGLVFCDGYGGFFSPDMVLRRFDKLWMRLVCLTCVFMTCAIVQQQFCW